MATEDLAWPFDQVQNAAAITSVQVMGGAFISHVFHDQTDGGWAFLHSSKLGEGDGRVLAMEQIVALDETVKGIADLPVGWMAWRMSKGVTWKRKPWDAR